MTTLSDATASTSTIEIGGTRYEISPLTLRDIGRIEQWMREGVIKTAREAIATAGPDLRADDKVLILDRAYKHADSLRFEENPGQLDSAEAIGLLIWLSIHHNHGDVSRDNLIDSVGFRDRVALQSAVMAVMRISGFIPDEAGNEEGGQSPPVPPKPNADSA